MVESKKNHELTHGGQLIKSWLQVEIQPYCDSNFTTKGPQNELDAAIVLAKKPPSYFLIKSVQCTYVYS